MMLAAPMMPAPIDGGGSWILAIVSLVVLAGFVWAWVASMRRHDRTVATPRPQAQEYPKAA